MRICTAGDSLKDKMARLCTLFNRVSTYLDYVYIVKACNRKEAISYKLEGVNLPVPFPEFYFGCIYTALELALGNEVLLKEDRKWFEAIFGKDGFVDKIRSHYDTTAMQLRTSYGM